MNNQAILEQLSNEIFHDFEKALEASTTAEEEEYWVGKIEALEAHIQVLQSTFDVENAQTAQVM